MRVMTAGHNYGLRSFEGGPDQFIRFIQKEPSEADPTLLNTIADGTTNEEVIAVLIDRLNFLQGKHPCRENAIVITKLKECLMWLNKRTADRKARAVEGTNQK